MIPLVPLLTALLTAPSPVRGVGVVPVDGRTEVVIRVDAAADVKDYRLSNPDRLVLDITGARPALPAERFANINRGGVLGLRVSELQPEIVRVVVELAQPVEYTVQTDGGEIRVSFPNPAGPFQPWQVDGRPADARAPESKAAPARPTAPPKPKITASFEATPILDVLTTFSEFSGKSIVAGADVTGAVTAHIRDQPWDVALAAILEAQGLTATELDAGIIQVEKADKARDREKSEELVTRQFRIKYIGVDSLKNSVQPLLSERGKLTVNRATNTLVVTDGRSAMERLEPMIRQFDVRAPQVTISAKILFVDRTALESMGIIYDIKDSRGNQLNSFSPGFIDQNGDGLFTPDEQTSQNVVSLGGSSVAALANATNRPDASALQILTSLVLGRHTLVSFIEALQSLSLSDIQAAPVVTVMDNREAMIQVGEETPIRVIDAGSVGATQGGGQGGGQNGQTGFIAPRATVQIKNTGVILTVTPHVNGDQILLDLHAERSNAQPGVGDAGVVFQTQKAETQVLVKDGATAVVGGLTLIEKTKLRSGIPVLMDLPVIGSLFRKTVDSEHKRDLLIMVTPHIVQGN